MILLILAGCTSTLSVVCAALALKHLKHERNFKA